MHDAHPEADARLAEGLLDAGHDTLPAQVPDARRRPQGHVHAVVPRELLAPQM